MDETPWTFTDETTDDDETRMIQVACDWTVREPSTEIPRALAVLENVKDVDLATTCDIRLYDYIDPGALDAVVGPNGGIKIQFLIRDYRILVTTDGFSIWMPD